MPFYEYRCRACRHDYEVLRPMSDRDKPHPCPKCESTRAERKLSTFAASSSAAQPGCSPAQAANCGRAGLG